MLPFLQGFFLVFTSVFYRERSIFMYASAYVWAKIINYLEERLTSVTVSAWFDDAEVVELNEQQLIIYSASDFRREVICRRCTEYIQDALKEIFNSDAKLVVFGDEELAAYRDKGNKNSSMDFNPQFSFDSFVVGNSNRFAHGAALAVTNNPGQVYNPLFIYGPPGVGKTHLLYAIANGIRKKNPDANVVYIKGDQFTNELISAIQTGKNVEFRSKYREADLFLIDDIQFIAGRESTQEEFFHTFNELYEDGKQIILASDRPPSAMKTLETRLKTRFEWGIIADIEPPNLELRVAIMKNKADKKGVDISYDILNYLAENLTSNVRQLEGAINRICAQSFLTNTPITFDMAKNAVSDMITNNPGENISVDRILKVVSQRNGVTVEDIKSRKRTETIAFTRHKCVYLIHKLTDMSFGKIGDIFKRDRTTMMNSVKAVEDEIKINSLYEEEINQLIREIKEQN